MANVAAAVANPAQREQQELAAFHLARGRRLFEQEDDRGATNELRRAIYLRPYDDEPHVLLGQIYRRAGRLAEAIDAFRIAVWSRESVDARMRLDDGDCRGATCGGVGSRVCARAGAPRPHRRG
jgi:Tfp pilus assembly protein PilF